jgi:hypothetical protein
MRCVTLTSRYLSQGEQMPTTARTPNHHSAVPRSLVALVALVGVLAFMGCTAGIAAATPGVESESVTSVTNASATLEAVASTETAPGGYYFEYGTSESYGSRIPAGSAPLAVGETLVTEQIQGLSSATTYFYRVVFLSGGETATGKQYTFKTQPATEPLNAVGFPLPDNRAWELVSPSEKYGARIEGLTKEGGAIAAAQDGTAMTYVANAPIVANPEGNISLAYSQIMSTRGADGGWSTRDIAAPHAGEPNGLSVGELDEYYAFNQDLTSGILEPLGSPLLSPLASKNNIFVRENLREPTGAAYDPLANDENTPPGTPYGSRNLNYVVASPDLRHVVVEAKAQLTSTPIGSGLYEWNEGVFTPISILPDDEFISSATAVVGDFDTDVRNAVSANGERVFWGTISEGTPLYMREVPQQRTARLDLPQDVEPPEGSAEAQFQYATPNGERVFFKDGQRLTSVATAEPDNPELYEYNTANGVLTDLTPNPKGVGHAGSGMLGEVIGSAENGEYVYFVAKGVLAGENREGQAPISGKPNLYVIQNDAGLRTTSFIAVLADQDEHDWETEKGATYERALEGLTARVSPNGKYLAFMSELPLTGYDNTDAVSGAADEEVYEYSVARQQIVCASCNPTGERPHGVFDTQESGEGLGLLADRPKIWEGRWLAASLPGWTTLRLKSSQSDYQSRYLADSGRLFFDSADALVARDTNGKGDVYQFELAEREGCVGGQVMPGGCLSLISSGSAPHESAFLDASESGDDVFFLTGAGLAGEDRDTSYDIYDAHACSGGSPCSDTEGVVSEGCLTRSSCEPTQPGAPSSESWLSGAVQGAGNVVPGPVVHSVPVKTTRAEKLRTALRACERKSRSKRRSCEALARRRYGNGKAKG